MKITTKTPFSGNRMMFTAVCALTAVASFTFMPETASAEEDIRMPDAEEQTRKQYVNVRGTVRDTDGEPVIGAAVMVKGTTIGAVTDIDGKYILSNVPANSIIEVSYVGMGEVEHTLTAEKEQVFDVELAVSTIDDAVVVAFGTQRKESMVSSVETIAPKELKVPSSNLTTALAGRVSGVIAYQRTGEPGADDVSFFIRGVTTFGYKKDPLILIDGIESTTTDLSRLQPDDIAAFSILKDATATALYGARGANGVIQVQTKSGEVGKTKVSLRLENSFSMNTQDIELADPVTFMQLANEAARTRNPLAPLEYSQEKIDQTIRGADPVRYPANDWRSMLMKKVTPNQRANINISGGGNIARFYVAATFNQDNGNLRMDKRNNFNSNINLKTYQVRSNVNINLTKTTEAVIRMSGTFDDYRGPLTSGSDMYGLIMKANPVLFPAYYPSDLLPKANHILFGNASKGSGGDSADYTNPYAEMVRGYKDYGRSTMDISLELKQNFDFLTKGLSARALFNTNRYSFYEVSRKYNPYYYNIGSTDPVTGKYTLMLLNGNDTAEDKVPTEYLNYKENNKDITYRTYIEAAVDYNRVFGKHTVSGMLVYQQSNQVKANQGDLQKSLPYRNQGLSGRFTYGFLERYLAEFNFGYNGSERFHRKERFGFFPAVGLAWIISKEKFWDKAERTVDFFKIKGSYGVIGNDAIGSDEDRFFYLSNVDMNSGDRAYWWGEEMGYGTNGVNVKRYANEDITWERAYKLNLGFEMSLFKCIKIEADWFSEKRDNILMERASIPSSVGLLSKPKANVGKARSYGVDGSIDVNKAFANGWWVQGRANFTFARSEYLEYEEPQYAEKYKLHIGQSLNQEYGLIAERLFIDEADVANSPVQTFGDYGPGDIKYVDVNNDGQITDLDEVPLGHPTTPEIVYGFGFSFGNKGFDFSAFFQGSARSSFWISAENTSPFYNDQPLLKVYADNHWDEQNRNIYALWPRMSLEKSDNNTRKSSWFMRNGAFLRLKSVELGYTFRDNKNNAFFDSIRVYLSGTNLFNICGFDLWDIEMGGDGFKYPIQRTYNIGLQFNF